MGTVMMPRQRGQSTHWNHQKEDPKHPLENHHDRQPVSRATSGSSSRTRHEAHSSQDFLPAL
jgi:hypothetical protein